MTSSIILRPWLTVRETAKELSKQLGSEITESDIFSYALNHKMILSVNFAGGVGGTHGYYHTTWHGSIGQTKFVPSDDTRPKGISSEALDLEMLYCHVSRGIVDYIYKKLLALPSWPLPKEGGMAVDSPEIRFDEIEGKSYIIYGTVFMVQNVSYNVRTGMLQSRCPDGAIAEGGFVVRTNAIQEFIKHAQEQESTDAVTNKQFHASGEQVVVQNFYMNKVKMGDQYNVNGQVGAIGPHAKAENNTFTQSLQQTSASIDLTALAAELAELRVSMRQHATEFEHGQAIASVGAAEIAAKKQDSAGALGHLRSAGKWAFDVATRIGTEVAAKAIQTAIGLQ